MFALSRLFATLFAVGDAAGTARWRLDDEGGEFMAFIDLGPFPTGFALAKDVLTFDDQLGFGILAFSTQDELVDENVEQVLEFVLVVGAIDDMSLGGSVADNFGLRTELEAKEFGEINGWTTKIVGNVQHVGDDRFDAVAFAFDLNRWISKSSRRKGETVEGGNTFD